MRREKNFLEKSKKKYHQILFPKGFPLEMVKRGDFEAKINVTLVTSNYFLGFGMPGDVQTFRGVGNMFTLNNLMVSRSFEVVQRSEENFSSRSRQKYHPILVSKGFPLEMTKTCGFGAKN